MRHLQSNLSDTHILEIVYVPPFTSSACPVASVAVAVNFARGLPAAAGPRPSDAPTRLA